MKALTIGSIVVGSIVGLLLITAGCYRFLFSQGVAESFEVNDPGLPQKVLIASQDSSFKNALVSGIIAELKKQPIYIHVVDISALPDINEDEWNALVVINMCQSSSLQPDVKDYLARTQKPDRMVLLTTSGSGTWKPEGSPVDSMSSASQKANAGPLATEMLKRLEVILGKV